METKKEQRNINFKKAYNVSVCIENKIKNIDIDEQFQQELLFCVAELKQLCKSQSEAIRLAYVILFYDLPVELKQKLIKQLKKELIIIAEDNNQSVSLPQP